MGSEANPSFLLLLGQKKPEQAAKVAGSGIVLMAVAGVLYTVLGKLMLEPLLQIFGATADVLPYACQYAEITLLGMPFLIVTNGLSNLIRADGNPRYSMLCIVSGAIANTILDPIFIFVCDWGVVGAALATVIGQLLSFVLAVGYLWRFKTIQLGRGDFRVTLRGTLKTFAMGVSSCVNQVAITLVQIVLNNSLTYYGAQSVYGTDIPLAACGIVMKTNAILLSIIVGISQGVQPLIGYNYGSKQYKRVREAYMLSIKWNFIISAIGFCLFEFFPYQIVSIFGSGNALYMEFSVKFMRIFLFMVIVNGVQLLSSNFFTAIGKATRGLLLALTRQVFFLIPLLLLLPLWLGIDGVILSGPIADFIAFVASVTLVQKELQQQAALLN